MIQKFNALRGFFWEVSRKVHISLNRWKTRLLGFTAWDNQVFFYFYDANGKILKRSGVSIKFDPVHTTDDLNVPYNIYANQVDSGQAPHVSSDSDDYSLWLNWHCGRSGSKYTAFNFDCAWKGDPNWNFFGPKPKSGIIAAYVDKKKQQNQMHSPSKANFWFVVWFTVQYDDGPSTYRLVLAQDGNADHIVHDLEEAYDLGKAGWEAYEGDLKGTLKELKDFAGDLGKDQHKNIWYLGVAGDLSVPPQVPNPPFGTEMPPVYMHIGDGSSGFNSGTAIVFTDTNGKHPIRATSYDGADNGFVITFLDRPQNC